MEGLSQVKQKILSEQSQTILRDLKHHSLPTFPIRRFERLEPFD